MSIFLRHAKSRKPYTNASNDRQAENVFMPSPFFPGLWTQPPVVPDTENVIFYAAGGMRLERYRAGSGFIGERLVPYPRKEYQTTTNGLLVGRGTTFHYIRGVKGKTINIYGNAWHGSLTGAIDGVKLNVPYSAGHMYIVPIATGFSGGNAGDVTYPRMKAFGIPGQYDGALQGNPEGQAPTQFEGSFIRDFYCDENDYLIQLIVPQSVYPGVYPYDQQFDTNFMLIVQETTARKAPGQWTMPPVRRQILLGDPDTDGLGVMLPKNSDPWYWPVQCSLWGYDTTDIGPYHTPYYQPWQMLNHFRNLRMWLVAESTDGDTNAVQVGYGRSIMAKSNRRKSSPENWQLANEVVHSGDGPGYQIPNDAAVPQTPKLRSNALDIALGQPGMSEVFVDIPGFACERIGFKSVDGAAGHPFYIRGWMEWAGADGKAVEMCL